ncbi:MAG TPA: FGGY-family carbohydrate kinase [Spirochaetota bacterium]|nr:FGGY-family carbohydrate kinase [Spirochaetota bacterium]HOD14187.1 FGGY-family carbohydrate kinase [Spirochaetota bacterium]HQL82531.1 FGGY-family carbohydrate kinase [Spirochaetota bacterium]
MTISSGQSDNRTLSGPHVLAIDLGSGGPKSAVISDTGRVIASAAERVPINLLPNGGAEQDPGAWWTGVLRTAKKALADSGVSPEAIVAIICTSQFSVVVPVDDNGEHLMNAVHWLDTRGGQYNREIIRGFPSIQGYGIRKLLQWVRLTGMAPTHSGVDDIGHILFIKHERPDIYRKTHTFLEPIDYLNLRLTGKIAATQESMITMLLVDARKWGCTSYDDRLLRLAGLPREKFPDLLPNRSEIGPLLPSVAAELGLSPSTPVIAGLYDTNASAIGSGAIQDFDGIIYIGTSLVLTCHLPFKKTDLFHTMTTMPSGIRDRYLLFAEQGTGGKALEFFLKNIVYAEDEFATGAMPYDAFVKANAISAGAPPGCDGIIFMPWLNGTICPEENGDIRGGFFNMSLSSTRGHMTRAVMEGLAYNSRWTLHYAEKLTGRTFPSFRFAGGGALSALWAQIHADILGVPINVVEDPTHTTLRGSALLALNKLGLRSYEEFPDLVKISKTYTPDASTRPVYDALYTQFRELFTRNKKIFTALNRK